MNWKITNTETTALLEAASLGPSSWNINPVGGAFSGDPICKPEVADTIASHKIILIGAQSGRQRHP